MKDPDYDVIDTYRKGKGVKGLKGTEGMAPLKSKLHHLQLYDDLFMLLRPLSLSEDTHHERP